MYGRKYSVGKMFIAQCEANVIATALNNRAIEIVQ